MQFNHYGGEAALLAADLVNLPPSSVAHDVAAVLTTHGVVDPKPTSDQARQLLGWAARLAPCFGTQHSHEQCRLVNELLATAASKPYISVHDGHRPHLHYRSPDDDLVSRVHAVTTAGLAYMICFAGGTRLGRCARTGCNTVFVDISRNGRRRHCTVRCANTAAVQRHRTR
ncbi:MAG: CGNR zinc finger domain-containing protein [Pseudonocardiaceae bacterium]